MYRVSEYIHYIEVNFIWLSAIVLLSILAAILAMNVKFIIKTMIFQYWYSQGECSIRRAFIRMKKKQADSMYVIDVPEHISLVNQYAFAKGRADELSVIVHARLKRVYKLNLKKERQ